MISDEQIDQQVCTKCITSRTCSMRNNRSGTVVRYGHCVKVPALRDCSIVDRYLRAHDPSYFDEPDLDRDLQIENDCKDYDTLRAQIKCTSCGQPADHAGDGVALCDPCEAEQHHDPRPDLSATCGQATECPCPGCRRESECNEPPLPDSAEIDHDDPINQG